MTDRPSPARALTFYVVRASTNAVRRRLRRLAEPRELVGLLAALAYLAVVVSRPGRVPPGARAAVPSFAHLSALVPLAAAGALLVLAALVWLFRGSTASLSLTEGEAETLFAAPVSRAFVVHFALLRSQLRVFIGALIALAVTRPGSLVAAVRGAFGGWILLATVNLHVLGVGFTKAAWRDLPAGRRGMRTLLAALVPVALLALPVAFAVDVAGRSRVLDTGALDAVTLRDAAAQSPFARPLLALLSPFRLVVAPLLAPSSASFLAALPLALAVLGLHHLWVVRTNARYEDATLASAARRAAQRARMREGRAAPVRETRRGLVPFPLAPRGRPEVAILWKNLVAWNRTPLATQGFRLLALALAAFASGALLRSEVAGVATGAALLSVCFLTPVLAVVVPAAVRIDMRRDLTDAAVLRAWPVSATGLVAAEVAGPACVSVLVVLAGAAVAIALSVGRTLAGVPSLPPFDAAAGPGWVAAGAAGALFVAPSFALLLVLALNGATLAFPTWFPPGPRRSRGLEHMGMNLVASFGTMFVLGVALLPSALLAAPVLVLGLPALGPWALPLAGLAAALPAWGEAALALRVLARLWESFDPSRDLLA